MKAKKKKFSNSLSKCFWGVSDPAVRSIELYLAPLSTDGARRDGLKRLSHSVGPLQNSDTNKQAGQSEGAEETAPTHS
ncbi:hypothetical protein JOQ06_019766, partial [Pogonophryne albipinna]